MHNRIRHLRRARNITLEQVASATGTSVQQISRLELGVRRLTVDWMERIAPVLGVRPADLLAETPGEGEVTQQIEELLLLGFWRRLSIEEKTIIARLAHAKGIELFPIEAEKRSA